MAALAKAKTNAKGAGAEAGRRGARHDDRRAGPGNQALQAHLRSGAIRAKLEIGSTSDPAESDADQLADGVMRGAAPCSCGGTCDSCGDASKIRRKASGEAASGAARADALAGRMGRGLDRATAAFFEPRFGADLSAVRVHDDERAADSARSMQARAFTIGNDIGFARGEYDPGSETGKRLLAHELAHVMQGGSVVRRDPDPRAPPAGTQFVPRPPGLPMGGGFSLVPIPADQIADPNSIPEGQLVDASSALGGGASGQGAVYGPPAPPQAPVYGPPAPPRDNPFLSTAESVGGISAGLLAVTGQQLRNFGFAAAGPNSIGMVMFPQVGSAGHFLPESRLLWGHTAMYVRQNGRITIIRSYAPTSLSDMAAARVTNPAAYYGTKAGTRGVPASIYNDAYMPGEGIPMFTHSGARSVEWPVSAESAEAAMNGMPELGAVESGLYTGIPARAGGGCGVNCVAWATPEAEGALGGPFGPMGEGGVPTSVADLGRGGTPGGLPMGASQGRAYNWVGQVGEAQNAAGAQTFVGFDSRTGARVFATVGEDGQVLVNALPEAATAAPVIGQMSRGMQVLRWGGRLFMVIGVVATGYEIVTARPEDRARTAAGALSGFAGGLAAGAAAGLVCGPGAPVCSIVLGLGFGIAGGYLARRGAEGIYDDTHPHGTPITDPAEIARITAMMNRTAPCPNCHQAVGDQPPQGSLLGRSGGLGNIDPSWFQGAGQDAGAQPSNAHTQTAAAPRTNALSDGEMQMLLEFVNSQPTTGVGPAVH